MQSRWQMVSPSGLPMECAWLYLPRLALLRWVKCWNRRSRTIP